jgi:hypothetical protein
VNRAVDYLEYSGPARLSIAWSRSRARTLVLITTAKRWWQLVQPWLAGAGLVMAYLLAQAWISAGEHENAAAALRQERAVLVDENKALRAELAEVSALRTGNLFFLIEGNSTRELRDKLQRLSMLIAGEHFALQESMKGRTP